MNRYEGEIWVDDDGHAFASLDHAERSVRLSWHKKPNLQVQRFKRGGTVVFTVWWGSPLLGTETAHVRFKRAYLYDEETHL